MVRFSLKYIMHHKHKFTAYIFISIITGIIGITVPIIGAKIIDSLVEGRDITQFLQYILVLIIISLANIVLGYISSITYLKLQAVSAFTLNADIIEHVKKLPLSFLQNNDVAYLNQRINNDSNNVIIFTIGAITNSITNTLSTIIVCFVLLKYSKVIGLILIVFIIVYITIYLKMKKPIYDKGLDKKEQQNQFFSALNEQFENVKFIKSHSVNDFFVKKLKIFFDKFLVKAIKYEKISYIYQGLDSLISVLAQITIFLIGGYYVIQRLISIGTFTVLNTYFKSLLGGVRYFFTLSKEYQDALASYNRIQSILSEKRQSNGSAKIDNLESISIKNLGFSYGEKNILKNFSADFHKNKIYCIIGGNGCGKSSLLDILLGLHIKEHSGEIFYNNYLMTDIDYEHFRKNIASYVEQNPVMVKDSLQTNLFLFSLDKVLEESISNLIDSSGLGSYLSKLPNGLKTSIYERSSNISGGERQKIAILRAVIHDTDLLIFDEPTSSMDSESIAMFISNLQKLKNGKIIILVSHDSKLINICDEVIKLD